MVVTRVGDGILGKGKVGHKNIRIAEQNNYKNKQDQKSNTWLIAILKWLQIKAAHHVYIIHLIGQYMMRSVDPSQALKIILSWFKDVQPCYRWDSNGTVMTDQHSYPNLSRALLILENDTKPHNP